MLCSPVLFSFPDSSFPWIGVWWLRTVVARVQFVGKFESFRVGGVLSPHGSGRAHGTTSKPPAGTRSFRDWGNFRRARVCVCVCVCVCVFVCVCVCDIHAVSGCVALALPGDGSASRERFACLPRELSLFLLQQQLLNPPAPWCVSHVRVYER